MQSDVQYKVITIVLLVSFFFNLMIPSKVEAVPVAPVVVAFLKDALISAGVTFVANEAIEHVARNIHLNSLTEAEKRALALEGGLSEVTVDDVLKKGYRVPSGTRKVYRVGKASLISGLLSGVLGVGTTYMVNYLTDEQVPAVDGISINLNDISNSVFVEWKSVQDDCLSIPMDKKLYYNYGFPNMAAGSRVYVIIDLLQASLASSDAYVRIEFHTRNGYRGKRLDIGRNIFVYEYGVDLKNADWMYDTGKLYLGDVMLYDKVSPKIDIMIRNETVGDYYVCDYGVYTVETGVPKYYISGEVQSTVDEVKKSNYQEAVVNKVNANPDKVVYVFVKEDGSQEVALGDATASGDDYPVDPPPPPGEPVVPPPPEAGTEEPDLRRIYNVITRRWPFSLTWDIAYLLGLVCADPVVPVWEFQLPEFMGENNKIKIDLGQYESIMKVVRWFEVFGFAWGLVMVVRRLYGGSV